MTYHEYLESALWKELRSEKRESIRAVSKRLRCECCKKEDGLHIHHWHYPTDFFDDCEENLSGLCPECHKLAHDVFNGSFGATSVRWRSSNEFLHDLIIARIVVSKCKTGVINIGRGIKPPSTPIRKAKKKRKHKKQRYPYLKCQI